MIRSIFSFVSTLALFGLLATGAASATFVPGETRVLARFTVDQLPSPDAEIWLIRVTLDSGGLLPAETQIGPVVILVESGAITLTADRPISVSNVPADAAMSMTREPGDTVLIAEQSALVSDGTTISVRNDGIDAARMLALIMYAPQREGTAGEAGEPVGATIQGLSAGGGHLPAGPGEIVIDTISIPAGAIEAADTGSGAVIGSVMSGTGSIELTGGTLLVYPGMATMLPDTEPEGEFPIKPGAGDATPIAAADGFAMTNGTSGTITASGDHPLLLLRARVIPTGVATPTA